MASDDEEAPPDDCWDADLVASLPGKLVLVGLTYLDPDGAVAEREQLYGRVETLDPEEGVLLALEGGRAGEWYWLPPDTRPFAQAAAGDYRLRSTGEIVSNPDYTANWTVYPPSPEGG